MCPEYIKIMDELKELHIKKSADYGGADPLDNLAGAVDFGVDNWKGVMIRANDKMRRIKTYAQTGQLENETVEDSFKDLANYAVLALVMWRRQHCPTPMPPTDADGEDYLPHGFNTNIVVTNCTYWENGTLATKYVEYVRNGQVQVQLIKFNPEGKLISKLMRETDGISYKYTDSAIGLPDNIVESSHGLERFEDVLTRYRCRV